MPRKSTVFKRCTYQDHDGERMTSLSDFHRNRTKPDGHNDICKICQDKVNRKRAASGAAKK
jgi:hypothetical protein